MEKMFVEIDRDMADRIMNESLKMHISMIEDHLRELYKRKKLEKYQEEDIKDNLRWLNAFKTVGEYYGIDNDGLE